MHPVADKFEQVESVVARQLKAGEIKRAPTNEEWAEAWQLVKARPTMPVDLVATTVFAHLKGKPPERLAYAVPPVAPASIPGIAMESGKACPNCHKAVAPNARTCPNCGHTFTTAGGIFIAVILALVIGGCVVGQM